MRNENEGWKNTEAVLLLCTGLPPSSSLSTPLQQPKQSLVTPLSLAPFLSSGECYSAQLANHVSYTTECDRNQFKSSFEGFYNPCWRLFSKTKGQAAPTFGNAKSLRNRNSSKQWSCTCSAFEGPGIVWELASLACL